jgi:hypothetical protein
VQRMAGIRDRIFYKERFAIDLEHNGLLTKRKVIRKRTLVEFNWIYIIHILMLIFHLQRQTTLRTVLSSTERGIQNIITNYTVHTSY